MLVAASVPPVWPELIWPLRCLGSVGGGALRSIRYCGLIRRGVHGFVTIKCRRERLLPE